MKKIKTIIVCLIMVNVIGCVSMSSDIINTFNNQELPIKILKIYYNPMSSTGVPYMHDQVIGVKFRNVSDKDIKYITFHMDLHNGVGDSAINRRMYLRDEFPCTFRYSGPVKPGRSVEIISQSLHLSTEPVKIILYRIEIEYMDGSIQRISVNKDGSSEIS